MLDFSPEPRVRRKPQTIGCTVLIAGEAFTLQW
jgi:hypothetical protein